MRGHTQRHEPGRLFEVYSRQQNWIQFSSTFKIQTTLNSYTLLKSTNESKEVVWGNTIRRVSLGGVAQSQTIQIRVIYFDLACTV